MGEEYFAAGQVLNLGYLAAVEGDHVTAVHLLESSGEAFSRLSSKGGLALVHVNLGFVALARGRFDDAATAFARAFSASAELGSRRQVGDSLLGTAALALERGEDEHALRLLAAAEAQWEVMGESVDTLPLERAVYRRLLSSLVSKHGEERVEAAREAGRSMPLEDALALAHAVVGRASASVAATS
jgi:tetratricopeptide (TPR) repeat protein